jgi:hypothetical protein
MSLSVPTLASLRVFAYFARNGSVRAKRAETRKDRQDGFQCQTDNSPWNP